jgi:hypothetical protein
MAIRPRIYDGVGMIGQLPPIQLTKDGRLTNQAMLAVYSALTAAIRVLNGFVSLGSGQQAAQTGNIDGQWIEHLFIAANTEQEIPHGLRRKAIGYCVWAKDRACDIYEANRGSWDENTIRLKSTVAGATVLIQVI